MWNSDRLLVFACSNADRYDELEHFDADLWALTAVRAREVREQGGTIAAALGVGHLVADGYIDYRYIYMEPTIEPPDEIKRIVLHTHGRFDLSSGRAVEITAGRNAPCPCGSGRKFKHCANSDPDGTGVGLSAQSPTTGSFANRNLQGRREPSNPAVRLPQAWSQD